MFAQIFLVVIALFLIYIGIVGSSALNIALGSIGLLMAVARFYALKSGSSLQEQFAQWRKEAIEKATKTV